jgi:hypothetical protein
MHLHAGDEEETRARAHPPTYHVALSHALSHECPMPISSLVGRETRSAIEQDVKRAHGNAVEPPHDAKRSGKTCLFPFSYRDGPTHMDTLHFNSHTDILSIPPYMAHLFSPHATVHAVCQRWQQLYLFSVPHDCRRPAI